MVDSGFTIFSTPIGHVKIEYVKEKITYIKKVDYTKSMDMGEMTPLTQNVKRQLEEYFACNRKTFNFPYELAGTQFQESVWEALCEIPYGETRTYKEIAARIGNPKASRAVGMANNKNPIAIVIPCHRVIGTNGNLVGYAGGMEMKKYLLNLESSRVYK